MVFILKNILKMYFLIFLEIFRGLPGSFRASVSTLAFSVYFLSEFLLYFLFSIIKGIFIILTKSRGIPVHFTLGYLYGLTDRDLGLYDSTT